MTKITGLSEEILEIFAKGVVSNILASTKRIIAETVYTYKAPATLYSSSYSYIRKMFSGKIG